MYTCIHAYTHVTYICSYVSFYLFTFFNRAHIHDVFVATIWPGGAPYVSLNARLLTEVPEAVVSLKDVDPLQGI